MTILVCFSGQIGSGKTSVSAAVAAALGWGRTGFGDYLRAEIARTSGDPEAREVLQDLGQRLVETDPEAFCRSVLIAGNFKPGDNFLIDGVRHVDIFRILKRLGAPSIARLLFLDVANSHRLARVRDRVDGDDFVRAETHRVESELRNELPALADRVVDATQPFDEVVSDCLACIGTWQQA